MWYHVSAMHFFLNAFNGSLKRPTQWHPAQRQYTVNMKHIWRLINYMCTLIRGHVIIYVIDLAQIHLVRFVSSTSRSECANPTHLAQFARILKYGHTQ